MGELTLAAPVAGLTGKGRITADNVKLLRGEVFRDGIVTRAERGNRCLRCMRSCLDQCDEWHAFFAEAMSATSFISKSRGLRLGGGCGVAGLRGLA